MTSSDDICKVLFRELRLPQVVYMSSSFLQLAPGSRNLSLTEKEIPVCKSEQIHKVTTILAQNDNFLHPGPFWVVILWICSALRVVTYFSSWDKSRDPTANWSLLEQMYTNPESEEDYHNQIQPTTVMHFCGNTCSTQSYKILWKMLA